MSKYYPSCDEILNMSEVEEAKKAFLQRGTTDLTQLLEEMIDHEERTGSFAKNIKGELNPGQQMMLNVFSKEKSNETMDLLDEIDNALKDTENGAPNLLDEAVYAKFASDFYKLYNL